MSKITWKWEGTNKIEYWNGRPRYEEVFECGSYIDTFDLRTGQFKE